MNCTISVAAAQIPATTIDHAADAWADIEALAAEAEQRGARLLVFPECVYPAYWLDSPERYFRPDVLRTDDVLDRFAALAAHHGLVIVAGLVEEADGELFNSAAVIDAAGSLLAYHRKVFLWDCDNRWFAPGDAFDPVDSELGRIGILICADARAPEAVASLAHRGAELIALPTAWINNSRVPGAYVSIQTEFLIEARAREFGLPFVCADKSGREPPHLAYVGQSRIVAAGGRLLAQAPPDGRHLVVARITPAPGWHTRATPAQLQRLVAAPRTLPGGAPSRPLHVAAVPRSAATPGPDPLTALGADLAVVAGRDALLRSSALSVDACEGIELLDGQDVVSFVAARCAALDGARALCIADAPDDPAILRARASENRVFVLAAAEHRAWIINPEGRILAQSTPDAPAAVAEIHPVEADVKRVTPLTDVWEQRRPLAYTLSPQPAQTPASAASTRPG